MYSIRFIIFFGALVSCQLAAGNGADTGTDLAVNFVASGNLKMQFPYFEPIRNEVISEKLRQQLYDVSEELVKYLDKLIIKMLSSPKKPSFLDWLSVGKQMNGILSKVPKEALELAKKTGFDKHILVTVQRVMSKTKAVETLLEKNNAPKDPLGLMKELHVLMFAFIDAVGVSKASVFAAWDKGRINDGEAEELFVNLMGRLRYHGYGNLLSLTQTALQGLLMYNKFMEAAWSMFKNSK